MTHPRFIDRSRQHMRSMLRASAALCASLLLCAQTVPDNFDYGALAKRPDAKVTKRVEQGRELVEIRIGDVVFFQMVEPDGKILWLSDDRSGHGAVGCMWLVYNELKWLLDACFPADFPALREDLDGDIDAINDFIVANNLAPITKLELEQRAASKMEALLAKLPQQERSKICSPSNDGVKVLQAMNVAPREKRNRHELEADLLSVPRPPAMSPCM